MTPDTKSGKMNLVTENKKPEGGAGYIFILKSYHERFKKSSKISRYIKITAIRNTRANIERHISERKTKTVETMENG